MDNYEVIDCLGTGSFGRVYKAKRLNDSISVALKVISKRGRSNKEVTSLRRECAIQKYLNHPNIIKMLDSFETKDEIVLITEFAYKDLNKILDEEGFLPEHRVQPIVWDLVSALNYLHSKRILHRDLKPQNILINYEKRAKLCDFGFARNMSTGTHVLTSIKGTPLYMAPELINYHSYDHNADLWSLGCIIYELLEGAPPFQTTSILILIKLMERCQIKWPTFLSDNCISFLKGLLQKEPDDRMTWPEILNHPFVEGHILIVDDTTNMPLTRPLSANTMAVKERQKKEHLSNKNNLHHKSLPSKSGEPKKSSNSKSSNNKLLLEICSTKNDLQDLKNNNLLPNERLNNLSLNDNKNNSQESKKSHKQNENNLNIPKNDEASNINLNITKINDKLNFIEDNHPIENEEWIVFLQKTMEEILNGEITSLTQQNLTNIIVSPLKNINANSKVISHVARLLSLPFALKTIDDNCLKNIKIVYIEVKLISNLVYASKLLLKIKYSDSNSSSPIPSPVSSQRNIFKNLCELSESDLQCLEYIYTLITHLIYLENEFLSQFCDSIVILNIYKILNQFLYSSKIKLRLTLNIFAILTHILRMFPDNYEIVALIIDCNPENTMNLIEFLRHSDAQLRERTCYFIQFLGKNINNEKMNKIWNENVRETLEALMYDSIENVRIAAEKTVEDLKSKDFYNNE